VRGKLSEEMARLASSNFYGMKVDVRWQEVLEKSSPF